MKKLTRGYWINTPVCRELGIEGTDIMVFNALVALLDNSGIWERNWVQLAYESMCGNRNTAMRSVNNMVQKGIIIQQDKFYKFSDKVLLKIDAKSVQNVQSKSNKSVQNVQSESNNSVQNVHLESVQNVQSSVQNVHPDSVQNVQSSVQNVQSSVQNVQSSVQNVLPPAPPYLEKNKQKEQCSSSLAVGAATQPQPQQKIELKKNYSNLHIPPEWNELYQYATEQNYNIDAVKDFYAYYSANGWTLKRGKPMRDWHALLYFWMSKERKEKTQGSKPVTFRQQIQEERQQSLAEREAYKQEMAEMRARREEEQKREEAERLANRDEIDAMCKRVQDKGRKVTEQMDTISETGDLSAEEWREILSERLK